jgi:hypothetical protein
MAKIIQKPGGKILIVTNTCDEDADWIKHIGNSQAEDIAATEEALKAHKKVAKFNPDHDDKDRFASGDGAGTKGGASKTARFEWIRDPEVTAPSTEKRVRDFVDKNVAARDIDRSAATRVELYDNPEDVMARLQEVGIDPEVDDGGYVRGAYDFDNHVIYASTWDGYQDSARNFLHELGHSILGRSEEAAIQFSDNYGDTTLAPQ